MKNTYLTLDRLADRIELIDDTLRQQAAHAVNCMLTARNWLIGCYIVEYEQKGADRAQYGEQLLKTLAHRINRKGMSWRRLYEYRSFYVSYPQLYMEILNYLQSQSTQVVTGQANILRSLPAIFQNTEYQSNAIQQPQKSSSLEPWQTSPSKLFHCINYTSLQMLSEIQDPLKRAFYEHELIQGCWSTRQTSIPKPNLSLLSSTISSRSLWNWVKDSVSRLDKSESSSTMIISRPTSYSTTAFCIAILSWI